MKRISLLLALLLCCSFALAEAPAQPALTALVHVSVTDGEGALTMAYVPVEVTDADADGVLTICDALAAAHAQHHPDGASAFAFAATEYGLSVTRLWGVENGGSYGYCLNDASAWSLADPITDGDHVKAYVYTDLTAWSDTYCFFAAPAAELTVNQELALRLNANGYDEMWNPVVLPVSGAELTVNGLETGVLTGAEGTAALTFSEPGVYVVSARSSTQTLVAPVCVVTVTAAE